MASLTGPHNKGNAAYVSTPDASRDNTFTSPDSTTGGSTSKNDPEARPSTPANKNVVH